MHLALILAVLAALLSAEASPDVPVAGVLGRLVAAAAAVAGVCLFAALSAGVTARRLSTRAHGGLSRFSRSENGGGLSRFSRSENGTVPFANPGTEAAALRFVLQSYDRLRRLHLVVWLAAAGAILIGLDWARVVRANWGLADAFLVDELLILLPVILPLVFSWALFYEVDRAVRLAAGGPGGVTMPGRWHYVALHARHYLGIVLAPVLAMVAVQDAAARLCPSLTAQGREGLVLVPCLLAVILLFPLLLRYVWATEALRPGPLREKLEKAAGRFGFRPRAIRIWRTGGMVANAAVAGFVRPLRYVFVSDGLIEELDPDELTAVLGHEAGHVRHRHLILRVLAMFLPFCLWLTAAQLFLSACWRCSCRFASGSRPRSSSRTRRAIWPVGSASWAPRQGCQSDCSCWASWGPTWSSCSGHSRACWSTRPTCSRAATSTRRRAALRSRSLARPWASWSSATGAAPEAGPGSTPAWSAAWRCSVACSAIPGQSGVFSGASAGWARAWSGWCSARRSWGCSLCRGRSGREQYGP